jgi:hypothetical protein
MEGPASNPCVVRCSVKIYNTTFDFTSPWRYQHIPGVPSNVVAVKEMTEEAIGSFIVLKSLTLVLFFHGYTGFIRNHLCRTDCQ